jgi:glutamate racemase
VRKNKHKSIFFFDSGQGGLTLWESVNQAFPLLNTIYLGDNARYPYGNKSSETILLYSQQALNFAVSQGAVLFIVACGTASSIVVERLQKNSPIPIIGVVDQFADFASEVTTKVCSIHSSYNGVSVLGTRFTIENGRLANLITNHKHLEVWQRACPLFVPLVEEGVTEGEIPESVCNLYLRDIPFNTSVILLACTHFPRLTVAIAQHLEKNLKRDVFFENAAGRILIKRCASKKIECPIILLDSSPTIIKFLSHFCLNENDLFENKHSFYCTDNELKFNRVAKFFVSHFSSDFEKIILS